MVKAQPDLRRVLSDPVRLRVLERLWEGPRTARALAASLGVIPNRLYYHLRQMEAAGVVTVVDAEATRQGAERLYGVTALGYGDEIAGTGEDRAALLRAMFMATAEELSAVAIDGGFHTATRAVIRATPEAMSELVETIANAVAKARASSGAPEATHFRFAYAAYDSGTEGAPGRELRAGGAPAARQVDSPGQTSW